MNIKLEKEFLLAIYRLVYGDSADQHNEVIVEILSNKAQVSQKLRNYFTPICNKAKAK